MKSRIKKIAVVPPVIGELKYPMRINKYMAAQKIASRREADRLIEAGSILLNGRKAVLGDKVKKGDKVELAQEAFKATQASRVYLAFNKPTGVVTHSPQEGEQAIEDILKYTKTKIFPLGRLDKESHGLILLTNDGRVTERLLSPELNHEKEYVVKVNKPLTEGTLSRLGRGIRLEDGEITKPAEVLSEPFIKTIRLVITEGKRHQIRRMLAALGYDVVDLRRVRIMNIELGDLALGAHREIKGAELKEFLKSLGL
ncbi:MAG: pseudouridine synthase [bacterium]|nr:pseudouridine synthase [bacterium]